VRHHAITASLHNSKKEHQLARKLHATCIVRLADSSLLLNIGVIIFEEVIGLLVRVFCIFKRSYETLTKRQHILSGSVFDRSNKTRENITIPTEEVQKKKN
jgi:arginine/lysine/ornithine decarboxylase